MDRRRSSGSSARSATASGQEVLRAVAAAAPYPRPPFDPKACLEGGRATIGLIGLKRCDETRLDEYTEKIVTRIQHAVAEAGVSAPEGDKVTLRVQIDREGAPAIKVLDAQSADVGRARRSGRARARPFEAPDDSIARVRRGFALLRLDRHLARDDRSLTA